MDASYAEVGTEVVICFYRPPHHDVNQKYCGRRTVITEVRHFSSQCRVAVDDGYWWWSISNMILASDIDLLSPEQRSRIR